MASILLVEDDRFLRSGLTELFVREGYTVEAAASAAEAEALLARGGHDLAVMDVTLPDGNGVELCRAWRARGIALPILFLTARDEEYEIVRGLDAGGNDYVTKPFRMQELLSRIRVLLRGTEPVPRTIGPFEVDERRLTVKKDGTPLELTPMEYKVLLLLMQSGGTVTRERLLALLWDHDGRFVDDNTLSVHMSRLREKVGAAHIRTVRGVGYQWQP